MLLVVGTVSVHAVHKQLTLREEERSTHLRSPLRYVTANEGCRHSNASHASVGSCGTTRTTCAWW